MAKDLPGPPKVCKLIDLLAVYSGVGSLCHILLESRWGSNSVSIRAQSPYPLGLKVRIY